VRHLEMGKEPRRASLDASKEITFTILSMTISLTAVFIPVLFMGGIVGRLLHEFAVTIAAAILVSGFVSLSLTPMLCSRFLTPPHRQKHSRIYNATERVFEAGLKAYDLSLWRSLQYRAVTMTISAALLAGAVYLFIVIPKGFLPNEDRNTIAISTEAVQGVSFQDMVRNHLALGAVLQENPNILEADN